MKILLVNYRYFISGGPERYMFNVSEALTSCGHEIIPFSIQYTRNQATPYAQYFVEPLGGNDEVTFQEQQLNLKTMCRTLSRLFYDRDVEQAVRYVISDTKPQIAYVLHYLRKLSPAVLVGLKKAGLPIVVRLSDYAMFCPQAHCLRHMKPCEQCVQGNIWPSIRWRCVQHSLIASILNALATWYHRFAHYFDLIDVFVTTTQFMYNLMISAGFPRARLKYIPTFVDLETFQPKPTHLKNNYIVYIGRLDETKGVRILIDAMVLLHSKRHDLTFKLKIVGEDSNSYSVSLKQKVQREGLNNRIQFIGALKANEISKMLSGAKLSVVPSLWYENLPNTILESYACGTPVLASNLGCIPECVKDGETGYLFHAGDASSLAERLAYCIDFPQQVEYMAKKARAMAEEAYSPQKHVVRLERLFYKLQG